MKRHPSLIPLSKFHRDILFLALIAKANAPDVKGYPETVEGKIDYALDFYEGKLKPHFEKEEKRLFETLQGRFEDLDEIIQELRKERKMIHKQFENLKAERKKDQLNQLGELLEKHVRKEERVFFQKVQDLLSPAELDKL